VKRPNQPFGTTERHRHEVEGGKRQLQEFRIARRLLVLELTMAHAIYDESLQHLLRHEGGYTNHPSDPGGPTKFGITVADYRRYVKADATAADIKAMTVYEAKGIYRARYWDAQRCDELPAGVDYAVFDYGVNSGIGRSGKVLRRVLSLPDATHKVGDEVIVAARRADAKALIAAICDERLRFLKSLKTWPVFGRGWGRRVADVKAAALAMAARDADPPEVRKPPDEQPASRGLFHALMALCAALFRRS
jgi:lysozyme family protein